MLKQNTAKVKKLGILSNNDNDDDNYKKHSVYKKCRVTGMYPVDIRETLLNNILSRNTTK